MTFDSRRARRHAAGFDDLRSPILTTFSPSILTHLGVEGRHRVLVLGSCAVQHKYTLLSVYSKTFILHSFYDPLSGIV